MFQRCAMAAHELNITIFAVTDGGMCLGDVVGDYDSIGIADTCVYGTGSTLDMDVYTHDESINNHRQTLIMINV